MRKHSPARARFVAAIRQRHAPLDLALAALCIAWEDQGSGDPDEALRGIAALAAELGTRITPHQASAVHVQHINTFLFDECGFHGNQTDYHDPANSFLDQVLVRRTGLPITLSVLYIVLGQRLGLPISGVALPGHFLVRYATAAGDIYVDPFHEGRLWNRAACEEHIMLAYERADDALIRRIMEPPSAQAILVRMLRNLKHGYIHRADYARALAAVERILLLEPDVIQEVRDRGLLRLNVHAPHLALDDLDQYARALPNAPDLLALSDQMRPIAVHLGETN